MASIILVPMLRVGTRVFRRSEVVNFSVGGDSSRRISDVSPHNRRLESPPTVVFCKNPQPPHENEMFASANSVVLILMDLGGAFTFRENYPFFWRRCQLPY